MLRIVLGYKYLIIGVPLVAVNNSPPFFDSHQPSGLKMGIPHPKAYCYMANEQKT
ncbi:hypothetical protein [Dyadobacter sp. CY312]|uniref:hypothetical protein n=1 Tax=Dyadobacter sp. CY312 TaxID=2907303 RepID=UPI001F4034C1|nr:hypothetical protein [Dyadobacter sp. CY312]MCE7042758.1 hypothetical protein [Dyadobacter sp. CY312]